MSGTGERDGLPLAQRRWAMGAICLTTGMAVADGIIANVALPTIARELNVTPAESIWVLNAYQLAVAVTLLPLAALGDRLGYKRVNLAGVTLFTLAAFFCSQATTLTELSLARVVQGIGAAMLMSVNPALLRFIYPRALLGRGLGFNAMIVALGLAGGPTIASAVLSVASWHWLFAVSVPLGVLAIGTGSLFLPATPRLSHRFDVLGALLTGFCFALLIGVLDGFAHGARPEIIAAEIVAMVVGTYVLVKRENKSPAPMLPVDLFRIPMFSLSIGTSAVCFIAQALTLTAMPFFLQNRMGYTAVETGFLMTPWPIVLAVAAPISGRLADRYSPAMMGIIGLTTLSMGLLSIAFLPADASVYDIAWRLALAGLGTGIFQSPNNRVMLSSVPMHRSGGAAGMLATARTIGQAIGAALVAVLFVQMAGDVHFAAPFLGAVMALLGAGVSALRLRHDK